MRKNVCRRSYITVPGCTFAELEQANNSELTNHYSWLKANKLSLNIAKTEFMVIGYRYKFLAENCSELDIQLDNQQVSKVEHAKSLGLIIVSRLLWSNHISQLCRKISSAISALSLRRISSFISQSTSQSTSQSNPTSFRLLCPCLGWIEFSSMWETTKIAKPSS